jgi:hypothetical protein
MGAGRPEPGPGLHQKRLGGGHEITDRCHLRPCLQKLVGALQKVCPPQRRVHRKILRNKHPPSSNHCQFIYRFAFVCIHTSYILLDILYLLKQLSCYRRLYCTNNKKKTTSKKKVKWKMVIKTQAECVAHVCTVLVWRWTHRHISLLGWLSADLFSPLVTDVFVFQVPK